LESLPGLLPSWFTARTVTHDDLCGAARVEPADLERLAALAGLSTTTLLHALPAFVSVTGPIPAGHRCALPTPVAAAPPGTATPTRSPFASQHTTASAAATGSGSAAPCQVDLAADPEIVHAHRQATRLARRHGVLRLLHAEITVRQQITTTRYHQLAAQLRAVIMLGDLPVGGVPA
jgi:hypothetical protein